MHAFMASHDDISESLCLSFPYPKNHIELHTSSTDLHVIAELLESTMAQNTVEREMKNTTVLLGHGRDHT